MTEDNYDYDKLMLNATTECEQPSVARIKTRLAAICSLREAIHEPPFGGEYLLVIRDGVPDYWFLLTGRGKVTIGGGKDFDIDCLASTPAQGSFFITENGDFRELDLGGFSGVIRLNDKKVESGAKICEGDFIDAEELRLLFLKI